jgi:hypothetical protein
VPLKIAKSRVENALAKVEAPCFDRRRPEIVVGWGFPTSSCVRADPHEPYLPAIPAATLGSAVLDAIRFPSDPPTWCWKTTT